jgi:hypothetical protein
MDLADRLPYAQALASLRGRELGSELPSIATHAGSPYIQQDGGVEGSDIPGPTEEEIYVWLSRQLTTSPLAGRSAR